MVVSVLFILTDLLMALLSSISSHSEQNAGGLVHLDEIIQCYDSMFCSTKAAARGWGNLREGGDKE